jgi:hypothetical protein
VRVLEGKLPKKYKGKGSSSGTSILVLSNFNIIRCYVTFAGSATNSSKKKCIKKQVNENACPTKMSPRLTHHSMSTSPITQQSGKGGAHTADPSDGSVPRNMQMQFSTPQLGRRRVSPGNASNGDIVLGKMYIKTNNSLLLKKSASIAECINCQCISNFKPGEHCRNSSNTSTDDSTEKTTSSGCPLHKLSTSSQLTSAGTSTSGRGSSSSANTSSDARTKTTVSGSSIRKTFFTKSKWNKLFHISKKSKLNKTVVEF